MSDQSLRHCYRCQKYLPLQCFGIRRASKDGLNTYCKACIQAKIKEGRVRDKERRERIKAFLDSKPVSYCVTPKMRAADLIREALGASRWPLTQEQLRRKTHLDRETLGEALAELILWQREVRSLVVNESRFYMLTKPGGALRESAMAHVGFNYKHNQETDDNVAQASLPRRARVASAA